MFWPFWITKRDSCESRASAARRRRPMPSELPERRRVASGSSSGHSWFSCLSAVGELLALSTVLSAALCWWRRGLLALRMGVDSRAGFAALAHRSLLSFCVWLRPQQPSIDPASPLTSGRHTVCDRSLSVDIIGQENIATRRFPSDQTASETLANRHQRPLLIHHFSTSQSDTERG
jgi:hypothetical protein